MAAKHKNALHIPLRHECIDAMLALAETGGWSSVTMPAISRITEISLSDLRALYDDRRYLISDWNAQIDERVLAQASETGSTRERLFNLLMERFDALNDNRAAVLAIARDLPHDPPIAAHALALSGRSMRWLLDSINVDTTGWRGHLRVAALTAIYLHTLRIWREDDSADMGKVMAALDKDLTRAEDWGGRFGFGHQEETDNG